MRIRGFVRTLIIFLILSINISCDQISKNIVRQKLGNYERIGLLYNHVTLTKVENTGAFLSLGDSMPKPAKILLLNIAPLLVLGFTLLFLFTKKNLSRLTIVGICFIVGGGIGNIYDRILNGSVTDFMHIDFVVFQTGIFNMADVSIMTGIFLLILGTLMPVRPLPSPIEDDQAD